MTSNTSSLSKAGVIHTISGNGGENREVTMKQYLKTKASARILPSIVLGAVVALVPSRSALAVCTTDGPCIVCQILYQLDGQICRHPMWECSDNGGDAGEDIRCI